MSETGDIEDRTEVEGSPGSAQYWELELAASHKRERVWREDRAPKVVQRFRDERERIEGGGVRTNILWSNTEILKAAVISEAPAPDVRRRFSTGDKVGRNAAMIIERALSYCADAYDMDRSIEAMVDDVLLPGRGVAWVVYEPVVTGDNGEEAVVSQAVRVEHVYWEDYREGNARGWQQMPWVARRHLMTREALRHAFTDHGDKVSLTRRIDGSAENSDDDVVMRAEVWEIWDRDRHQRVWMAEGYPKLLRVDDDPYGLRDFFPCPEPVYAIANTKNRVPLPLFSQYQDQAAELDRITDRINNLVEQLKWRGVYDASEGQNAGLKELADAPDGHFEGVQNWSQFQGKGGLQGVFDAQDNRGLVEAVQALFVQRDQLLNTIFQITGISDIVRGATDPRETKGAQQLKSQFASLRIQRLHRRVNRFVRDLFRIKGEIIAEHFTQERLAQITQVALPVRAEIQMAAQDRIAQGVAQARAAVAQSPDQAAQVMQEAQNALAQLQEEVGAAVTWEDVIELLRSDDRRSNKIDIETDQTAFQDAQVDRAARLDFVSTITAMVERTVPAMRGNSTVAPFLKEMVLFAARSFKAGRVLEEALEDAFDQINAAPAAPPQPDPALLKAQAEIAAMQARVEIQARKAEGDLKIRQAELQAERDHQREKLALDALMTQAELRAGSMRRSDPI